MEDDLSQQLLIHLDGTSLPTEVYETWDLSTLEEEIMDATEGSEFGEWTGHEFGPEGVNVFFDCTDAGLFYKHIEPVLLANPLCQNATVKILMDGADVPSKHAKIPMHR